MTDLEREWKRRLVQLALDAGDARLPCVEHGLMAIATALGLKQSHRQIVASYLFRNLADLMAEETEMPEAGAEPGTAPRP